MFTIVSADRKRFKLVVTVNALHYDADGSARDQLAPEGPCPVPDLNRAWGATDEESWLRLDLQGRELAVQLGDEIVSGASQICLRTCPQDWREGADPRAVMEIHGQDGLIASLTPAGWCYRDLRAEAVTIAPLGVFGLLPAPRGPHGRLSPRVRLSPLSAGRASRRAQHEVPAEGHLLVGRMTREGAR